MRPEFQTLDRTPPQELQNLLLYQDLILMQDEARKVSKQSWRQAILLCRRCLVGTCIASTQMVSIKSYGPANLGHELSNHQSWQTELDIVCTELLCTGSLVSIEHQRRAV